MPIRRLPFWAFAGLSMTGMLALLLGGGMAIRGAHGAGPPPLDEVLEITLLTAVVMAWGVWTSVACFRRMDEFHQAAGRFAWYWGGSVGLAASVILYTFVGLGGLHWILPAHFPPGKEAYEPFLLGYMTALLPILAGFLGVRLWWQASK